MKKIKCLLAILLSCSLAMGAIKTIIPNNTVETEAASSNVIAFPGAVGGGKYATGGRGGEVYHVTNLNDSGTGSFRDAVSKSNRIVVFDVSGTIELKSNILVSSNVTIAGQTAPGGSGITLKNYKLGMSGDNIICRFISSRPGPYKATSSGNDAWGGAKGSNSIIDHCSMGWTTDEQWALYSNNEYYTVQYSVIGPADSWGGHSKGLHGFGIMLGKGYCTFDHNLIVHNVSRNFRGKVQGTATADFTNNVIYNWAYQTAYGTIGHLNYVNNTLKMGNGTTGGKQYVYVDSSTKPENFAIYCTGNRMLNKDGSVYSTVTTDNWNGISVKASITETYGVTKDSLKSNTAFKTMVNGENVSTANTCESAEASYEHVLEYAGNGISSDTRTAIDQQCAEEVKTGTGNMSGTAAYSDGSSSEKANLDKYNIQCGVTYSYPSANYNKITDTDKDGMEDVWELQRGLNPNDASDTNGDYCGKGYTNIEYYINDLTVNAFPEGVVEVSPTLEDDFGIEPIEGKVISSLEIKDLLYHKSWGIDESLAVGDLVFGDREVTFTNIDDSLVGAEYILTACDAKKNTTDLAVVTAAEDMVLSVGFDSRLTNIPEWASGFTKTEKTCSSSNDVTFIIYQKEISAGESVTLGAQGTSSGVMNYIAMAMPVSEADVTPTPMETATPEPTETATPKPTATETSEPTATETVVPTETATVEPTESEEPADYLLGDVDRNGEIDAKDALLVLKHAAKISELDKLGILAGNVNKDENVDAADALEILKFAARIIDSFDN